MRPPLRFWLEDPVGAWRVWRWWRDVDRRRRAQLGPWDLRQVAAWEARGYAC